MATTPLAAVKEKFENKQKLVAAIEKFAKDEALWVARTSASKGLAHVSNAKLMRLHQTFSEVKEKFGTRAKLIDAICELEKRAKDEGFKTRLGNFPVPRLYDMFKSATKRNAASTGAKGEAKKAAPKKAAAPAKKAAAPASKPAAKKAASKKG